MVDLAGAHLVDLDVMRPEEALQLFTRIVGEERVTSEREAALDVVAACGFLPLAIRIAASRLAARRTWTVSVLAAKLADERRRLDELQAGDLAVKATFELGYGQLEPAQARAFRLLGLADGPDISLAAAAAVLDLAAAGRPRTCWRPWSTPPCWSRPRRAATASTTSCGSTRVPAPSATNSRRRSGTSALSRLLDFYLATAARVYALERPGDRLVDHLEPTGYPGLAFADRHDALDWLFAEAQLPAGLRPAGRRRGGTAAARRRPAVGGARTWRSRAPTPSSTRPPPSPCATRRAPPATPRAEGRARTIADQRPPGRGPFRARPTRRPSRRPCSREAAQDPAARLLVATTTAASSPSTRAGTQEAEEHLRQAIESFRADGNRPGEASALCNLSRIHVAMGRTAQRHRPRRAGHRDLRPAWGTPCGWPTAATPWASRSPRPGGYTEALEQLAEALELFRDEPAAAVGGHRRTSGSPRPTSRPAAPTQAAQHAEQALALRRHRRRVAPGQRADRAGQGAGQARAGGPGAGLLARGAAASTSSSGAAGGRAEVRALLTPLGGAPERLPGRPGRSSIRLSPPGML